jgi:hypothetical protein
MIIRLGRPEDVMKRGPLIAIAIVVVLIIAASAVSIFQSTGVNRENPTPVSGNGD